MDEVSEKFQAMKPFYDGKPQFALNEILKSLPSKSLTRVVFSGAVLNFMHNLALFKPQEMQSLESGLCAPMGSNQAYTFTKTMDGSRVALNEYMFVENLPAENQPIRIEKYFFDIILAKNNRPQVNEITVNAFDSKGNTRRAQVTSRNAERLGSQPRDYKWKVMTASNKNAPNVLKTENEVVKVENLIKEMYKNPENPKRTKYVSNILVNEPLVQMWSDLQDLPGLVLERGASFQPDINEV